MVFSSAPVYLDPPNCNWNKFHANLQAPSVTSGIESHQLSMPPTLVAAPQAESGTPGSIWPRSMSERARMAKIPLPEAGLKCPRCESTNTKFCYFNNYSLTQPRYFCKTCRRYWTCGGALRNVPVGGGCRRNKRRKSSASSSKSASSAQTSCQDGTSSPSSTAIEGGSRSTVLSSLFAPQSQLQLMASLHGLSDCPGAAPSLGLGFPGMQSLEAAADYQPGNGISGMELEHWRMPQIQQLLFLGQVEAPPTTSAQPVHGLYQFEDQAEGEGIFSGTAGLPKVTSAALITQMTSVKMEDAARLQGAHSSRKYLGMSIDERYWGSDGGGDAAGARVSGANSGSGSCAGWATDLAGFNSTSSGNILR